MHFTAIPSVPEQHRLKLPALQSRSDGFRNGGHIRHQRSRFIDRAVLPEGDKVKVLSVQKLADALCVPGQTVICGYRHDNRSSVSKMGFAGQGHRRIGNPRRQLCQGVAGPMGSAPAIVSIAGRWQIHSIRLRNSAALPKRLSVSALV